jgi:hypothetical protein
VLTARSDRVHASQSCGIWDGKEPRVHAANSTIQSNQIELTILPVDRQWELRELDEIRQPWNLPPPITATSTVLRETAVWPGESG